MCWILSYGSHQHVYTSSLHAVSIVCAMIMILIIIYRFMDICIYSLCVQIFVHKISFIRAEAPFFDFFFLKFNIFTRISSAFMTPLSDSQKLFLLFLFCCHNSFSSFYSSLLPCFVSQ